MNDQNIDYSKIDEVSEDGVRLFKVMMRLEFALKDAGYVMAGQRQAAEVQWDRYAKEKLGSAFWSEIKKATSAAALIESPPKRQVVDKGGNLAWEDSGAVRSVQELVGALRRVRNNLFHGGKSGDIDAERNARLYAASFYVIEQILIEDDIVQTIFTGQY
ncbi:hypothetical protein [Thioclava sp.]|uniref:hypothetical protein n=1 Tax=Thioclava sp. TaxID=1933450 RepID=UPI003AA8D455